MLQYASYWFLDGITWILSYNYIGIVGRILKFGSKTPNFTGHLQRRRRMYVDLVELQYRAKKAK